jgi:hypothetical protein
VISVENNGTVDYPLFQLSSQPNQDEVDFPASLATIASASYNNVDPANSFLTLSVADDKTNIKTENVPVTLPFNEDIVWVVTFDYAIGQTKFLFKTKNDSIAETFTTDFPEFYLRRNLQLDLGCNATFAAECGVVRS